MTAAQAADSVDDSDGHVDRYTSAGSNNAEAVRDDAWMWCDLLLGHAAALSAHVGVTRRAELYMRVAGLPLSRVLDALQTDAAGWEHRLADLRASEATNLKAYEAHQTRVSP